MWVIARRDDRAAHRELAGFGVTREGSDVVAAEVRSIDVLAVGADRERARFTARCDRRRTECRDLARSSVSTELRDSPAKLKPNINRFAIRADDKRDRFRSRSRNGCRGERRKVA